MLIAISIAVAYATITQGGFPGRSRAFAAPVTGLTLPGVSSSVPQQDMTVLRPPTINKTLRAEQPVAESQQTEAEQFAAISASPTIEAPPEDAVVRAASVAPAPDLPAYQVIQVEAGDTVSSIAARFGIDAQYIVANNVEIHDENLLTLGQSILIPAGNGILHEVRFGDTLSEIADRYAVDVAAITEFRANRITTADQIPENGVIYVPGATLPQAAAVEELPADEPALAAAPEDTGGGAPDGGGGGAPSGIVAGGPSSGAGLIWPVSGPISSYMGGGHPLGIDIDGFNLSGAAVAAATSGTVVFAGGNACCSYGLYVVVVSPAGIETLYAHLSSIAVVQGQEVAQGEALGIIGDTGYSTGTHLHLEVLDNGVRVNPLSYLP